jgi:hypothetical protein
VRLTRSLCFALLCFAAAIRGVNTKLGELEGELLRSQQTIDIPLITLEVHKIIAEFLKQRKAEGKTTPPTVEEMGAIANDTNFLNEVQRGLGEWKKQITSVTKLNRSVLLPPLLRFAFSSLLFDHRTRFFRRETVPIT